MKTIFKIALATTAVAATTPSFAETFERDGYTYVYNVTQKADTKQIEGKYYPGAREFALKVRNDRVSGTINGNRVSFPVSAAADATGTLASAD